MQVRRKTFSYPVLNHDYFLSTYNRKNFNLVYELKEDDKNLYIENIRFDCDSEFVNKRIEEGLIKVVCVVECSDTVFRKKYNISNTATRIMISKDELSNKVELSIFAYASNDFLMTSSDDFDEDYQGFDYQIEKYNILCANDGIVFAIIHEEKEGNLVKSIFSIIPIEESDKKIYDVDVKTNKIEINMSKENWLKYRNVYQSEILTEEFFCVLLIPALIEALFTCKNLIINNEEIGIEDIEQQYSWFRSITYAYKNLYGKELDLDEFKSISPVSLSQELLGQPLKRALETIENSQGGEEQYE